MAPGTAIFLKARPIPEQLADRLAEPVPPGLELYLDRQDLLPGDWLDQILHATRPTATPPAFEWIVEAPIRTLGDRFFDLTCDDEDHEETLRRVVKVGAALNAVAANVHVVAPTLDSSTLTTDERSRRLAASLPLLDFFSSLCRDAGMVPLIENVPPIGRMREGAFVYSSIGATPQDLLTLIAACPGVRSTVDVSHAGLYLNWRRAVLAAIDPAQRSVAAFFQAESGPASLGEFVAQIKHRTESVHVSNAAGLLGEGLPYHGGEFDLDAVLAPLVGSVPYFVTETLEPDQDHAVGMRDAQRWLRALATRPTRSD